MPQPITVRVRAVPGRLVPHERDPRRYIGLRTASAKERESVDEKLVMHRIPGVLADGQKRGGPVHDVLFVDAGAIAVERTLYIERALMRGDLVEVKAEPEAATRELEPGVKSADASDAPRVSAEDLVGHVTITPIASDDAEES